MALLAQCAVKGRVMPTLLVLVGIPGSGKTTLAEQLCAASPAWQWINQDTLGDRRACEAAVSTALAQGRSPIVDRCNFNDKQRATWARLALDTAAPSRVHTVALQLLLPLEVCIQRVQQRTGHLTLAPAAAQEVCSRFYRDFMPVQPFEGFQEVLSVRTPDELPAAVQRLQALQDAAPPPVGPGAPLPAYAGADSAGRRSPGVGGQQQPWGRPTAGHQMQSGGTGGGQQSVGMNFVGHQLQGGVSPGEGHAQHTGWDKSHASLSWQPKRSRWSDEDGRPGGSRREAGWQVGLNGVNGWQQQQGPEALTQPGNGSDWGAQHAPAPNTWQGMQVQQPQQGQLTWQQQQQWGPQVHQQHQQQHGGRYSPHAHFHSANAHHPNHHNYPNLPIRDNPNHHQRHGSYRSDHAIPQQQQWPPQGDSPWGRREPGDARHGGRRHDTYSPAGPSSSSRTWRGQQGRAEQATLLQTAGGTLLQVPLGVVAAVARGALVHGMSAPKASGWRGGGKNAVVNELLKDFADPSCKVPYDELPFKPAPLQPSAASPASPKASPSTAVAAHTQPETEQPIHTSPGALELEAGAQGVAHQQPGSDEADATPSFQAALCAETRASSSAAAGTDTATPTPACAPPVDDADAAPAPLSTAPILLFDLNGTLTSHTASRYGSGVNRPRPGTQLLLKLRPAFRLGIFTSATVRTAATAVAMLEAEAGVGPGGLFEHGLVLHRMHTCPLQGGAKRWDTVKPLGHWFARLHRLVLFDDDAHKARPEEADNLVQVPCWDDKDIGDEVLGELVQAVMEVLGPLGPDADVRAHTATISARLLRKAQEIAAAATAHADAELQAPLGVSGCGSDKPPAEDPAEVVLDLTAVDSAAGTAAAYQEAMASERGAVTNDQEAVANDTSMIAGNGSLGVADCRDSNGHAGERPGQEQELPLLSTSLTDDIRLVQVQGSD